MTIRRDDNGWSSEERQALLLAALYESPSRIHTTERLRGSLTPYRGRTPTEEAASRRRLNRDIDALVARGLVARYDPSADDPTDPERPASWEWLDQTHPDDVAPGPAERTHDIDGGSARHNARRESGIRLLLPDKPERLFLTSEEHQVLARARDALGRGPAATSPFAESDSAPDRLDYAGMLIRHLEESGDSLPVQAIGPALDLSPRQVEEVLTIVQDLDAAVDHHCMLSVDDDGPTAVLRVTHGRQDATLRHPGRAPGGLNAFSRAAYTRAETRDRLDVIEQALSSGRFNDDDVVRLRAAQSKLASWSRLLSRALDAT